MWISGLKGLNNLVKSQLGRLITRPKKHFKTSNIAMLIKIRFEFIRFFKLKFTVFEVGRQDWVSVESQRTMGLI